MKVIEVKPFEPLQINIHPKYVNDFHATEGKMPHLEFIMKMDYIDNHCCINWPFITYKKGYPTTSIWVMGKTVLSGATVSIMYHKGMPPTEAHAAVRVCRNKSCVNPHHIFWTDDRRCYSR